MSYLAMYRPKDNEMITKSVKLNKKDDGSTFFQVGVADVERLQRLIKDAAGRRGVLLSFNVIKRGETQFFASQMYVDSIPVPMKSKRFIIFKPKSKSILDKLRHKLLKWCMKGVNVTSKMKQVPMYLMLMVFLAGCGQGTRQDGFDLQQMEQDIADLQEQNEALQELYTSITPGTALTIVDPCPHKDAAFEEVLVCMNDEKLLALYYDHKKKQSFFALIEPGNYVTTDARQCKFEVVEGCEIK